MCDWRLEDPIKFDAVYDIVHKSGKDPEYRRSKCVRPMNGSFVCETKIPMDGAQITVGSVLFGGQEIFVPLDAISRRP